MRVGVCRLAQQQEQERKLVEKLHAVEEAQRRRQADRSEAEERRKMEEAAREAERQAIIRRAELQSSRRVQELEVTISHQCFCGFLPAAMPVIFSYNITCALGTNLMPAGLSKTLGWDAGKERGKGGCEAEAAADGGRSSSRTQQRSSAAGGCCQAAHAAQGTSPGSTNFHRCSLDLKSILFITKQ